MRILAWVFPNSKLTAQSHSDENDGSHRAELGLGELVPEGNDERCDAQDP